MLSSLACDLREVCDTEDLALASDFGETSSDDLSDTTADTSVNLVKNQGRDGRGAGADDFQCETNARQFPS